MAKLIEIGNGQFLNPDMVVLISPQGTQSVVLLVNGRTITVSMDAQNLVKKCTAN
jgi:hypothetical protein